MLERLFSRKKENGSKEKEGEDLKALAERWKVEEEELKRLGIKGYENDLKVGKLLLRTGLITENFYLENLSEILGLPYIDLSQRDLNIPFFEGISVELMKKKTFIPFKEDGERIFIAMANPYDLYVLEKVKKITGKDVEPYIALEERGLDAISRVYEGGKSQVEDIVENLGLKVESREDVEALKDLASEAPIIKLVNLIIGRAVEAGASDIHIEPFEREVKVRYRIDGVLHEVETLPKSVLPAVVSRIKIMARLNIAERRVPQDGRIKMRMGGKNVDIRVASLPKVFGEEVVMRLLDQSNVMMDLESLGFPKDVLEKYYKVLSSSNGMILVTGPTGSGKTTTLFASLKRLNKPEVKIITIEDPVEYVIEWVNQIQVNPQVGLTFASGLRSIVRQDPDIIMVGEIRDLETAEIAVHAALTGHLVFSTLHTNDAPGAITRLIDMGVEDFLVASSVICILAQRLVRVICENCKEEYKPPESMIKAFGLENGEVLYKGRGCKECGYTGYKGRTGIYEMLVVTDGIRNLITKGVDSETIKKKAIEEGMRTLFQDGLEKAKKGITTLEEVIRVAYTAKGNPV